MNYRKYVVIITKTIFIWIWMLLKAFWVFLRNPSNLGLLNGVNLLVITAFTLAQVWFLYYAPHLHNPLDNVKLKVWRDSSYSNGCFLSLEIKNDGLIFIEELRMGWGNLPTNTWVSPLNTRFNETEKFKINRENFIVSNKFSLAPDESKRLNVVMTECNNSDFAWANWHSNKINARRTDRNKAE